MAKWSDLPVRTQLVVIIVGAVVITGAAYFLLFKPVIDQNTQTGQELAAVRAENDSLKPFQSKLSDLERQIESLKQQLEIQKRIVPDEKEADQFIRLVQSTASTAGIEVRSYSSKPVGTKEFFVEVPFELNVDGPYYSVLGFFDKLGKLERIINVTGLQMAAVADASKAKVKRRYNYAPTETVAASFLATTYFSHDVPAATAKPAAAPAKK
ncbi:MAG TPA: type 4a pilus biogenesis protein PilO [Terriglobales bacterium]|nr:type 4a pilus biogenesis protein PilO [Terriglobales bacterium]